jgi:hypothetical protein
LKVTAPDGTVYSVGRQWWPERRGVDRGDVLKHSPDTIPDDGGAGAHGGGHWWPDLGDADEFIVVLAVIAAAVVIVVFLTTVVVPVIAFTIELLIVLVLFFAGLAGRLLFRRPWTVRARSKSRMVRHWQLVGFRASGRLRDDIAAALRDGRELPA